MVANESSRDLKVRTDPLPPWPAYGPEEIEAVARVLRSGKVNYWTGTEGTTFETEFAERCACARAVAVANGTVALELALLAAGIGPGDDVIVTPRTFVASATAIVRVGARPIFADVDENSQNITADTIRAAMTARTRGVVCVHIAGLPCDMDPISKLAAEFDLVLVEDCAQAHGARYKGRPVGSLGHVAAFSFCTDKIMPTAGEGGMVTTNSESIWRKAWEFKDHGKSYDAVFERAHPPGFRWLHESFGTNWRLTEMQSAVGRVVLGKLQGWVEQRRANAQQLTQHFSSFAALRVPLVEPDFHHSYYRYDVFVRPELLRAGWDRDRIMNRINQLGIPCRSGTCSEIYLEKAFTSAGLEPAERLVVARRLGETSLTFPVHPTLEQRDLDDIKAAVGIAMEEASHA